MNLIIKIFQNKLLYQLDNNKFINIQYNFEREKNIPKD